jgi:malonyl-CoA/methylmalonyl-CoA synthetase
MPRDMENLSGSLFPGLGQGGGREAVRFPEGALTYDQLRRSAWDVAGRVSLGERVAVWAAPRLETCVAVVGALLGGAVVVPVNPKMGTRELKHLIGDARPQQVLAPADQQLPEGLASLPRTPVDVDPGHAAREEPKGLDEPDDPDAPAFVFYTSGTTGPPKGAILPRRAVASNLDALAEVWEWTEKDTLVHGLPLFHVHGMILGLLGPIRLGGTVHHVGRFSAEAVARELADEATMLFGVPTMYRDLGDAVEQDAQIAAGLQRTRLLVSGSAALSARDWRRIERTTGQRIAERYGLTETLMNCAVRAAGTRRPGVVGPPLPGVQLRLTDDDGAPITGEEDIGEVEVRGPNVFLGYLDRPDATEAAMRDGWFRTGDLASREPDGSIRLMGRRATDLIKTAGYKVGAGEVETALLEHPAVAEAAVTGKPDPRLGERVVAWVVLREGSTPSPDEIEDHVADILAPHKRPREVRFVPALPRNDMGKVVKAALGEGPEEEGPSVTSSSLNP